jgi:hypothetical protein
MKPLCASLSINGPLVSTSGQTPALGERVAELFSGFGEFLSIAAVVIIGLVVYGVPALLLLALLFWLLFGRVGLLKKLWRIAAGKAPPPPR